MTHGHGPRAPPRRSQTTANAAAVPGRRLPRGLRLLPVRAGPRRQPWKTCPSGSSLRLGYDEGSRPRAD